MEDDTEEDVRLLFDQNEAKILRSFTFSPCLHVSAFMAEQREPGALQSGIFLWPAAVQLCRYLCHTSLQAYTHDNGITIVELGAGAGLVGLCCGKLCEALGTRAEITFTDRDHPSLDMIRRSCKEAGFGKLVKTRRVRMEWTAVAAGGKVHEALHRVDLIVGSDLIYSTESALALVRTLDVGFSKEKRWVFLLCSSFRDPETTRIVQSECDRLALVREELDVGNGDLSVCSVESNIKCWFEKYYRR